MHDLAELIAERHARWMPPVVEAILGTNDPESVAHVLVDAVTGSLGVPVVAARFYEPGVGVVVGLELLDGRAVVAKVHRAGFIPRERLEAIARVQADLAAAGVPAPAPLVGPLALGNGWLTVEEDRGGDSAPGHDPAVRRGMATALHDFVEAARPHAASGWIGTWLGEPVIDDLWPEPHDLRFDFPGTAAGAEWIDDAVGLVPEAALVGSASVIHPVDWRLDLPDQLPRHDQVDGFVADYEAARSAPFDGGERKVLAAAQRWVTSFGARCQHSDDVLGIFPDVDHSWGWPRLLRELLDR